VAADGVGVDGDQIARLDDPLSGLLEPRVGAGPGRQQAGLDILPAQGNHSLVEQRPHLVLGPARHEPVTQGLHPDGGRGEGTADAGDLLGGLDRACALERRLSIHQVKARLCQRSRGTGVHPLDADGRRRAAVPADLLTDLASPGTFGIADPVACRDVARRDRRPYLVYRLEPFGQVHATGELEQHDRTLGRDHKRASRVAEMEYLHVPRTAGIADAHRVNENARVDRAPRHLVPDPPQPVAAKCHHVDRVLGTQGVPYGKCVSQPGNRTASSPAAPKRDVLAATSTGGVRSGTPPSP
jgi:hypothetical protein